MKRMLIAAVFFALSVCAFAQEQSPLIRVTFGTSATIEATGLTIIIFVASDRKTIDHIELSRGLESVRSVVRVYPLDKGLRFVNQTIRDSNVLEEYEYYYVEGRFDAVRNGTRSAATKDEQDYLEKLRILYDRMGPWAQ
jgi:hypothetical protein